MVMLDAAWRAMKAPLGVAQVFALVACGPSAPPAAPEAPATVYVLAAPALPPAAAVQSEPAPPVRARPHQDWHAYRRGEDLRKALSDHARNAVASGLLPVAFITAPTCEPCRSLKQSLPDPRMQSAFSGTSVLEIDMHQAPFLVLSEYGMQPSGIPAFYVLDEQGHVTGATITGAAWGDDIPENMAPPLIEFFSRQPR